MGRILKRVFILMTQFGQPEMTFAFDMPMKSSH